MRFLCHFLAFLFLVASAATADDDGQQSSGQAPIGIDFKAQDGQVIGLLVKVEDGDGDLIIVPDFVDGNVQGGSDKGDDDEKDNGNNANESTQQPPVIPKHQLAGGNVEGGDDKAAGNVEGGDDTPKGNVEGGDDTAAGNVEGGKDNAGGNVEGGDDVDADFEILQGSPSVGQDDTYKNTTLCYVCESKFYNKSAAFKADPCFSPRGNLSLVRCSVHKNGTWASHGCGKIVTELNYDEWYDIFDIETYKVRLWKVSRFCEDSHHRLEEKCATKTGSNSRTETCFCHRDKCNGAPSGSLTTHSVVLFFAALLMGALCA